MTMHFDSEDSNIVSIVIGYNQQMQNALSARIEYMIMHEKYTLDEVLRSYKRTLGKVKARKSLNLSDWDRVEHALEFVLTVLRNLYVFEEYKPYVDLLLAVQFINKTGPYTRRVGRKGLL